jgi:hypothetical protein
MRGMRLEALIALAAANDRLPPFNIHDKEAKEKPSHKYGKAH